VPIGSDRRPPRIEVGSGVVACDIDTFGNELRFAVKAVAAHPRGLENKHSDWE